MSPGVSSIGIGCLELEEFLSMLDWRTKENHPDGKLSAILFHTWFS